MSNRKTTAPVIFNPDSVQSIRDFAYQHAKVDDATKDIAKWAIDNITGFPESLPDEPKAELSDGYRLRYHELHQPVEYAVIGGQYLKVETLTEIPAKTEKVFIGVDVAFSYTQQQFGRIKEDNPALHAVIGAWRTDTNKYVSKKIKGLISKAKSIRNEDKPRQRSAVLDFDVRLAKMFDTLRDNCKTAQSRGDETANLERFSQAKAAFFAKWNHSS